MFVRGFLRLRWIKFIIKQRTGTENYITSELQRHISEQILRSEAIFLFVTYPLLALAEYILLEVYFPLRAGGPSGLLTLSFAPFGRSGRVTHASVIG